MTYQVITHLGWERQPAVSHSQRAANPKPWTKNEALLSASSLIISATDKLARLEINEIFLESILGVFESIEQAENRECRSVVICQASALLDAWFEDCPNWNRLIEDLTKALKLLHSLADMPDPK
jgi:hypothetical protein